MPDILFDITYINGNAIETYLFNGYQEWYGFLNRISDNEEVIESSSYNSKLYIETNNYKFIIEKDHMVRINYNKWIRTIRIRGLI